MLGLGSAIITSTLSFNSPSNGIVLTSSTALLTSRANLITNEYISKLKNCFSKLLDWINLISLLYEKTLKTSNIDKKIDEKESDEIKKTYNHYLDKREEKEIMKNTQFKVDKRYIW